MSENYQVLALKWRPKQFKDVVGQEHITATLQKAFEKNRIAQAFLFAGPRGVGKTTTARLIAKALNFQKNDNPKINCSAENFCPTCQEIINSNHIDILEMDAASKTGIDDVR